MSEAISFYLASDGRKLFYRTWNGSKDKVPCLIFIHGIESHSGWFSEVGEKLTRLGLEVYALDRRGSGLNKEERGDVGDFRRLIQDIDDFFLQKELRDRNCILVGLCWGAKTALYFSLRYPERISRIVFVTPGFKTRLRMPLVKKVEGLLALIFTPHAHLALPIEPEMFTEDQIYLNRIKGDNLRLKTITPRFFKENLRLEKAIEKLDAEVNIPCLLFLAEKDEIVDNNGVIMFLKRYFRSLEINSYLGCRHGLFFEPRREEVIRDLASWCFKY